MCVLALACAASACSTAGPSADPAEEDAFDETKLQATDDLLLDESDGRGNPPVSPSPTPEELRAALDIVEDYRPGFDHGEKGPEHQKYIMLHDTEGESAPQDVVDFWDGNGNLVAAHFVVGRDGSIVQCVPLDRIAHHAGFGDAGHMNSHSVGIELVHVGGAGEYPQAQLEALDALIAYIDAYYGFESAVTDHKAWRSGNSDTSPEFAAYLNNYQTTRTHDGG